MELWEFGIVLRVRPDGSDMLVIRLLSGWRFDEDPSGFASRGECALILTLTAEK